MMLYNFYRVKANKGMTLIELLVAISILATVAVMGWYALGSILRARQILEQEMRNMHDVQIAFSQIEVDCEKIAPRELNHRLFYSRRMHMNCCWCDALKLRAKLPLTRLSLTVLSAAS